MGSGEERETERDGGRKFCRSCHREERENILFISLIYVCCGNRDRDDERIITLKREGDEYQVKCKDDGVR